MCGQYFKLYIYKTLNKYVLKNYDRDEKRAFITTTSGQLIVHDLENNQLHHSHKVEGDLTDYLLASSSGQFVVMATSKGKITILSAENCNYFHFCW
jgi:hypothetical protein